VYSDLYLLRHQATYFDPTYDCDLESASMKSFRRLRCILLIALATSLLTVSLHATTPEEKMVLAPVNAMFDGMAKRDPAAIQAPTLAGGSLVIVRDGKTIQLTFAAFADRIGSGTTRIEERIHDPLVRIDRDLAVVWAPFDFLVEGKEDHCGTDLFNLVNIDGKWVIAGIAANDRKDCPGR
jgi:Putative lumazine-binding